MRQLEQLLVMHEEINKIKKQQRNRNNIESQELTNDQHFKTSMTTTAARMPLKLLWQHLARESFKMATVNVFYDCTVICGEEAFIIIIRSLLVWEHFFWF